MTTYIAHFTAQHRLITVRQQSVFIWQQESGEIDEELLAEKIKKESALHFYRMIMGRQPEMSLGDIEVRIEKVQPFDG